MSPIQTKSEHCIEAVAQGRFAWGSRNETLHLVCLRFSKFAIVGGFGVVVDMATLYALTGSDWLKLDVALAKSCSSMCAMICNFVFNEFWTFKNCANGNECEVDHERVFNASTDGTICGRFLRFSGICLLSIPITLLTIKLVHSVWGWNLYIANIMAIAVASGWNFGMNLRYNWRLLRPVRSVTDGK
jgi:dolichol-phosphate mannosyltransferase